VDQAVQKTKELLILIFSESLKDVTKLAIPFSGSLDSSLVAFLANAYTNAKITLYTIGFEGCYDFGQSLLAYRLVNKSAQKLRTLLAGKPFKYKRIKLTDIDLRSNLSEYLAITKDTDKVSISYTLPFFILLKNIKEKYVLTGHGADTLFGGFHKYLKTQNLKLKMKDCYKEFTENLEKREFKLAKYLNKKLILPFANEKLAEYVLSLPGNFLIRNGIRKHLLRKVADDAGLPEEITQAPKKALQYSTNVMKHLRRIEKYRMLNAARG
jgi:asparagine synthase (glutamine-hydrolysing)